MTRFIRIAIESWKAWWLKRRLYKHHPWLKHFDEAEKEARRKHKAVEPIRQARRDYMTSVLRRQ